MPMLSTVSIAFALSVSRTYRPSLGSQYAPEDLCCAAARSRGRFWLADRPDTLLAWDAAGGALCVEDAGPWLASLPDAAWDPVPPVRRATAAPDWHPERGDRCRHLVFTSPGLDRDGLARLLHLCLLTDAEYAAGPEMWKRLPTAFAPFSTRSSRPGPRIGPAAHPSRKEHPWPPAKAPASRRSPAPTRWTQPGSPTSATGTPICCGASSPIAAESAAAGSPACLRCLAGSAISRAFLIASASCRCWAVG